MKKITVLFLAILISILCSPAFAQNTSSRFSWGMNVGASAAGKLFTIKEPNVRSWNAPKGNNFNAYKIDLVLDEGIAVETWLKYKMSPKNFLSIYLSNFGYEVTALARTTQIVEVEEWDKLSLNSVSLLYRRTFFDHTIVPFINGGVRYTSLTNADSILDQSIISPVIGLGLQYHYAENISAHLELNNSISSIDCSAYKNLANESAETTSYDPTQLFSFTLGMGLSF